MFQADALCDFRVEKVKHVVERDPGPSWRLEGRTDENTHYISYCIAGEAEYIVEGRGYHITGGDLLLLPSGTPRIATCCSGAPWRFYSVGFSLSVASEEDERAFRSLPRVLQAPSMQPLFQEALAVWQRRGAGYLLGTRGLIEQVLYEVIRLSIAAEHNPYHYVRIERVLRKMQAECARNHDIDALAREAGFSTPYFRSLFKRVTGRSVVQYQNYVRVSRAKDLLRSGAANVTEASYLTGFHDIYYFSRLFKRMTGHAPSHYLDRRGT